MIVAFVGERNGYVSDCNCAKLRDILSDLIERQGADTFLIRPDYDFDRAAAHVLVRLRQVHPHIRIVLAYAQGDSDDPTPYDDCLRLDLSDRQPLARMRMQRALVERCDLLIAQTSHASYTAHPIWQAQQCGKRVLYLHADPSESDRASASEA